MERIAEKEHINPANQQMDLIDYINNQLCAIESLFMSYSGMQDEMEMLNHPVTNAGFAGEFMCGCVEERLGHLVGLLEEEVGNIKVVANGNKPVALQVSRKPKESLAGPGVV